MNVSPQTTLLNYLALLFLVGGVVGALYVTLSDPESPLAKAYFLYVKHLDHELRALFLHEVQGRHIVNGQLAAVVVSLIALYLTLEPAILLVLVLIAIAPKLYLWQARQQRISKLETQLDTFLLALSNALKASPSLGDALGACTLLLRPPISQELELMLKENALGTPLDVALLSMAHRVGSFGLSGSLTTILIGRQTGGDLPKILEQAASTLREMARLEGVVRTKTAEGKAQAWVLGGVPPFLVALLNWMDPEWLKPLSNTFIGNILIVIAVVFWVAAILAARKILAVDI